MAAPAIQVMASSPEVGSRRRPAEPLRTSRAPAQSHPAAKQTMTQIPVAPPAYRGIGSIQEGECGGRAEFIVDGPARAPTWIRLAVIPQSHWQASCLHDHRGQQVTAAT